MALTPSGAISTAMMVCNAVLAALFASEFASPRLRELLKTINDPRDLRALDDALRGPAAPDDICRRHRPEGARALHNSDVFALS